MLLRRPVIAQPTPSGAMAPLAVGVVPFQAPEPRLAVVMKVTCTLRAKPDGTFVFERSESQEPLSLPTTSTLVGAGAGELAYPGDFAPRKAGVDILVTGHAHSQQPTGQIHCALYAGTVTRQFVVATSGAATKLPLTAPYLRGPDGFSSTDPVNARAVPEMPEQHLTDFDYQVYNAAPASQRTDVLAAGSKIYLRGLWPSADYIEATLPAFVPNAVLVSAHETYIEAALRCDTLWLDTDRSIAVFVYRGDVQLIPTDVFDLRHIIVWLDEPNRRRTVDNVRRDLPRGVFGFAVAAEDLSGGGPPGDPAEIDLVRYSTFDVSPDATITLEQYATISAELVEGRWKRDEVLRRHKFDEDRWLLEERAILGGLADAAAKQDTTDVLKYGDLFIAAQDALAEPWEKDQTVDDYIDVKAEIEAKGDPHEVLGKRSMRLATWLRLDRRFTRAALQDPAFAEMLEERLAIALQRYGVEPDEPAIEEIDP